MAAKKRNVVTATVIRDTREPKGKGWDFNVKPPSSFEVSEIIDAKLDAGDYTLLHYENRVAIERKRSLEEFLGNIGRGWERFERALIRLDDNVTDIKLIIIEDDLKTSYARFQKSKFFNLPPSFILKRMAEIKIRFGVDVLFLSNRTFAQQYVLQLFKRCIEYYGTQTKTKQ